MNAYFIFFYNPKVLLDLRPSIALTYPVEPDIQHQHKLIDLQHLALFRTFCSAKLSPVYLAKIYVLTIKCNLSNHALVFV